MTTEAPWDHYRTFEAVARLGSLTAAARALGLSQSTVSRHLASLEAGAGSPLLLRETPVRLTRRGEALLGAIRPMTSAALGAQAALEATPELRGLVTVTTVGEVVRWALAGHLADFCQTYPHLRLRLLADNRVNSLAAGEADVAVRLARPTRGDLTARKLCAETFGYFAARSLALGPDTPWLGLTGSLARIPEQLHTERAFAPRPPRVLVEDVEALGKIVQSGVGVATLPRRFAAGLDGVVEVQGAQVGAASIGPTPPREFWLVVHRAKQRLPRVRAVMTWLERTLAAGSSPAAAFRPPG